MTILVGELKGFRSEIVNDTSANGGRFDPAKEIVSGAAQNVFEHVFKAQRTSGLTRYRKTSWCNRNDSDETGYGAQFFYHIPPTGDHFLWWHVGTHDDTQDDITGSERKYGSGKLGSAASAGASILVVDVTDSSQTSMFADGDTIIVSDKTTPTATTGNEEIHTVSGTPSVSGTEVTITISTTLANAYAAGASVSSTATGADLLCSVSGWTDASDNYDETTCPLVLDNIGTVYDTWTLTYDGSGGFSVTGANEGTLATGSVSADYAPPNGNCNNKPYFTLEAAGHSASQSAGETLIFTTNPAAINIWQTLTVPAGASPVGTAGLYVYMDVETA